MEKENTTLVSPLNESNSSFLNHFLKALFFMGTQEPLFYWRDHVFS